MTRRGLLATLAAGAARASDARSSPIESALAAAGFNPAAVDYRIEDAVGRPVAEAWPEPWRPVAPGSLWKPFVALAHAQANGYRYPVLCCAGEADGCWLPRGHGEIGIEEALAGSCNAYFRALVAELPPEALSAAALQFGLPAPPGGANRDSWWGLGAEWLASPERLLAAYRELAARRTLPGAGPVVEGLRRAAARGTAAALRGASPGALAKTGTAPCAHPRSGGHGDGFVCAVLPPGGPVAALLVRAHGKTGRETAGAAAALLFALGGLRSFRAQGAFGSAARA